MPECLASDNFDGLVDGSNLLYGGLEGGDESQDELTACNKLALTADRQDVTYHFCRYLF